MSIIKKWKAKLQANSPWNFQNICNKIDGVANKLAKEIIKYEPLDLLHRAFWANVSLNIKDFSDRYSDHDRDLAGQTLEFVQNYLVSLEPVQEKRYPLGDKGWKRIENLVRDFNNYMTPFFILRSKDLQEFSEQYDFKSDALQTLDIMHWWNVRGNRYPTHQITQVRELLLPQKQIFEDVFKYGIEEFLNDLEKIQHSLTFGFGDAIEETFYFYEKTVGFAKALSGSHDYPTTDQMKNAIEKTGVREKSKNAFEKAFGLALCDVGKITDLPPSLLDRLSWELGEDKDFWAPGMYAGWPLQVTPLRKRPFIKLHNRVYCFDINNLFDNIYRKIENLVLESKPESREIWNITRKDTSEKLSLKYLSLLLPGAKVYSPAYYGKKGFRAETDGIIIYDDVLLIVEVKSGALDMGSPLLSFDKHQKKLIELIENPATQAKNFREYLITNNEIEIYNGNHKNSLVLSKLKAGSFRKIYQCTVSVDNLTHLTSRARKLSSLGIQVHTPANWSVSLDDLRVYAEIFESPLQFLHFLEQREAAEKSELVELNDELDHLGLYVQKNNYSRYADELVEGKKPSQIIWASFTQEIDDYFAKLFFEKAPKLTKPNQKMPGRMKEIITLLEKQKRPGRARVASFILDGAEDYRDTLENAISRTLQRQTEVKRLNPFFIGGEMSIAGFCLHQNLKLPNKDWRRDYVKYRLLVSNGNEALTLILQFNKNKELIDVDFEFVSMTKTTMMELERIRLWGEHMKNAMTTYYIPTSKS